MKLLDRFRRYAFAEDPVPDRLTVAVRALIAQRDEALAEAARLRETTDAIARALAERAEEVERLRDELRIWEDCARRLHPSVLA